MVVVGISACICAMVQRGSESCEEAHCFPYGNKLGREATVAIGHLGRLDGKGNRVCIVLSTHPCS